MRKLHFSAVIVASLLSSVAIAADTPAVQPVQAVVPQMFTLKVSPVQVGQIGAALQYLPKNIADPLIEELNKQIVEQQAPAAPAAKPADQPKK